MLLRAISCAENSCAGHAVDREVDEERDCKKSRESLRAETVEG